MLQNKFYNVINNSIWHYFSRNVNYSNTDRVHLKRRNKSQEESHCRQRAAAGGTSGLRELGSTEAIIAPSTATGQPPGPLGSLLLEERVETPEQMNSPQQGDSTYNLLREKPYHSYTEIYRDTLLPPGNADLSQFHWNGEQMHLKLISFQLTFWFFIICFFWSATG